MRAGRFGIGYIFFIMRSMLISSCTLSLLFALNGYGQIVTGNIEIKVNQGFIFGGEVFDLPASGSLRFDADMNFKNADLIVLNTFCPLCMGCCCSWEVGSSRPFYISRIHYDSTDFSKSLDLNDTARFQLVDSTKGSFGKILPHTGIIPLDRKYIVFKNAAKKYALLKPAEITKYIPDYSNPMNQCTNGLKGFWMLQNSYMVPYFPNPSSKVVEKNSFSNYRRFNYFHSFLINGRKTRSIMDLTSQ